MFQNTLITAEDFELTCIIFLFSPSIALIDKRMEQNDLSFLQETKGLKKTYISTTIHKIFETNSSSHTK